MAADNPAQMNAAIFVSGVIRAMWRCTALPARYPSLESSAAIGAGLSAAIGVPALGFARMRATKKGADGALGSEAGKAQPRRMTAQARRGPALPVGWVL